MSEDARQFAPSAARNRDPIWAVLRPELPASGLVLEVASGSGEHTVHFARLAGPQIVFQPSDPDAPARASIDAWAATSGLSNILPALALDAAADAWPIARADVVVCINMIHIAPWASTVGLVRGAARVLPPGGLLFLYGPYRRGGRHTAPSNAAFDADLRRRNPAWGVRDLEAVADLASRRRLHAAGHRRDAGQQPLRPLPPRRVTLPRGTGAVPRNRERRPDGGTFRSRRRLPATESSRSDRTRRINANERPQTRISAPHRPSPAPISGAARRANSRPLSRHRCSERQAGDEGHRAECLHPRRAP